MVLFIFFFFGYISHKTPTLRPVLISVTLSQPLLLSGFMIVHYSRIFSPRKLLRRPFSGLHFRGCHFTFQDNAVTLLAPCESHRTAGSSCTKSTTQMKWPLKCLSCHFWKDPTSTRNSAYESAYWLHCCWLFAWEQVFPVLIHTPHLGTSYLLITGWSPLSLSWKALSPLPTSFYQSIFLCFQEEEEKFPSFPQPLCESCIRIRKKDYSKELAQRCQNNRNIFNVLFGKHIQLEDLWTFIYRRH